MRRPPSVTSAQMREVDRLAVEVAGVSLLQMMENAGRGLAVLVRRRLGGDVRGRRIAVLVGTGGNGGGGLVAARRLANWGGLVRVVLTVPPDHLRGVPAHQLRALALTEAVVSRQTPAPGRPSRAPGTVAGELESADVVIDSLLGYGVAGAPRGAVRGLIELANDLSSMTVALDLPSGLDPDTGVPVAAAIRADATLTVALPKTGLLAQAAGRHVGDLYVLDIGIPPEVFRRVGVEVGDLFADDDLVALHGRA